jgi:enoyl-CoA hydratase/carnithine racemase
MADKLINYRADGGIAILTLDDPPANTYTHQMMRDLDEAILAARFDDGIHVILIRGQGEKFFCGSDESACTMDSTENCICPGCAVFDEYELEFGYFCLNAIEEKGRDEE